jgi:hypothetical protein
MAQCEYLRVFFSVFIVKAFSLHWLLRAVNALFVRTDVLDILVVISK